MEDEPPTESVQGGAVADGKAFPAGRHESCVTCLARFEEGATKCATAVSTSTAATEATTYGTKRVLATPRYYLTSTKSWSYQPAWHVITAS